MRPRAKKQFGQHFLERAWVDKLVRAIEPANNQTFIEIGPGAGALTLPLADAAERVVAIEIDRELAQALSSAVPSNVTVVERDFLEITPLELRALFGDAATGVRARDERGASRVDARSEGAANGVEARSEHVSSPLEARSELPSTAVRARSEHASSPLEARSEHPSTAVRARSEHASSPLEARSEHPSTAVRARSEDGQSGVRVVGNLPYNVASPILFRLVDLYRYGVPLIDANVMLQREVADRLLAAPSSRDYGIPTVLIGHSADIQRVMDLPPGAFRPIPKVHSTVVRLRFRPDRPPVRNRDTLSAMVQAVFTRRRKTLANALFAYRPDIRAELNEAIARAGIDGRRRPESLSIAEFARLADRIEELRSA